jgi:hypothetical protein
MDAEKRDNRARRFLSLVLPFVVVFAVVRFLPPAAFWIAFGLVILAVGVYAGVQTRRELRR